MNSKLSLQSIMKIVNIIFLIVLENTVLDSGMGLFSVSLCVYYLLYAVLFSSLQTGIGKMVSIRNTKGISDNSKRIVKPVLLYVITAGILVLLFAFLGLDIVAERFLGMVYPVPVIQIFCVVLILAGITEVLCGYHNGNGNALVTNIVNLLTSILPIIFSFFIIRMFRGYGNKVSGLLKNPIAESAYAAMGIAFVYLLSAIIVFLVTAFFTIKSRIQSGGDKSSHSVNNRRTVANGLFSVNSRLMLHNVFPMLSIFATVFLYINGVKKAGLVIADAYTNLGIIFTKLLLPILLIFILFSEYIARERHRLHVDYRKDEIKIMTTRSQYMIKNSFFMLIPPSMVLIFLAGPIAKVVYAGQEALSAKYLQTGGAILLLAGVAFAMSSIIKAFDREVLVWTIQGGALVAQIIFLVIGFSGATGNSMLILYSFYFYYAVLLIAFMAVILRIIRLDLLDILMKLGKYGVAGIIMMILFLILDKFIAMNVFLLFLSIFFGYLLYYLTLIALHGISKKDEAALKRTLNYYPVHFLRSRLRL